MFDAFYPILAAASEAHGDGKIEELMTRFGVEWPYLTSQIISFAVVAFLLYRFAFKPVLGTLEERQTKIAEGLRYTEEMKAKLADAEKQHAETVRTASIQAQKIVDEARAAAKTVVERETAQAAQKAQDIVSKAEEAIELDRRKMLAEARDEMTRLVITTSSKVLSRELSSDERRRYAESASRELTGA
jgi:F-type H+-transporting ATPase subunit b